jgi:CheY-like chemotaxis protein
MPGLDGIELHRLLVERGASIPMILVTAFPDRVSRERANALGVVGYLAKPVSPDELLGCLRAALGGSVGGGEASDLPDQGGPHE